MENIIKVLVTLCQAVVAVLVCSCIFMSFLLVFFVLIDAFTGRDVLRKDVQPIFKGMSNNNYVGVARE